MQRNVLPLYTESLMVLTQSCMAAELNYLKLIRHSTKNVDISVVLFFIVRFIFLSWVNDFVCLTKHVIEIDARENCVFKDALYWYNYMKGNNNKNSNITAKKYLWYYDIKEIKYGYGQNKEAYQNDHIKTDYFCD